jgi:hypothetical protein
MCSIRSFAVQPAGSRPCSSKRIDSGTSIGVNPQYSSAAYSVAPTPQASAPEAPPMQVWLSVAWMKSPGSMICSRATWWQMPGDTPPTALKLRTPVCRWNSACMVRSTAILGEKRAIWATPSA